MHHHDYNYCDNDDDDFYIVFGGNFDKAIQGHGSNNLHIDS
jgi:hypothetical protein